MFDCSGKNGKTRSNVRRLVSVVTHNRRAPDHSLHSFSHPSRSRQVGRAPAKSPRAGYAALSSTMMPLAFALLAALAAAPTPEAAAFVVSRVPSADARRRAAGDASRLRPLMMNKRAGKRRPSKKSGGGFGKKPRVTSMNIKRGAPKSDFVYAG